MDRDIYFFKHYSSPYYDPAKAHEYYLKTRQLKGRTTGKMSDAQKEAWGYTKKQITDERNLKIEQLREKATQAREEIYKKLTAYANQPGLKGEAARAERARIAKELKTAIQSIKDEYESKFDKEYDNILSTIKGKAPKAKKPKKAKKKEPEVNWDTFDKT
jgi:hypothetical protein